MQPGQRFRLTWTRAPATPSGASAPTPRFAALVPGAELLLDDGRLRLRVDACDAASADTQVLVGGRLSDRKGRQRAGRGAADLPRSRPGPARPGHGAGAGRRLDRAVLQQRPEDIIEARERIGDRARIIAKLEKPSAVERLDEIIAQADALMVARGDLGVELPAEQVPAIQKRARGCRRAGKPVIVATQMLESMIESPVPTRAEASDVATAIYDGADAVMLSAESATGKHPQAAVAMMSRIIEGTEADPQYRQLIDASHSPPCRVSRTRPRPCCAMRHAAALLKAAAIVCFTSSGATSLRAARERPEAPVLSLTPSLAGAAADAGGGAFRARGRRRRASTCLACAVATQERFCSAGQTLAIIAGMLRQGRHHQPAAHRHRLKNQI